MEKGIARRALLKQGGLAGLGLLVAGAHQAASAIGLTPSQPEGPFYPVTDQADKDVDLTRVKGRADKAQGQTVVVGGAVVDTDGRPVEGAMVEIWQACVTGRYNHPEDPNTEAELDENFQYWGRTTTDRQGLYAFRTIKPGAYPADAGWVRPPHIHFRVAAPGHRTLTTQMYWQGEPLNGPDRILRALPAAQRQALTVTFRPRAGEPGVTEGRFDIVVGRPGALGVTPELD